MPKTYIPPRDSLAALVCGYFQNNPTEELGLDDIVEKFSLKSHARVHTDLSDAWRADLIRRDVRDGDVIYSAGNLEFTTKALATKPGRKTGSDKPAKPPRATPAPVPIQGFPDPLTVPIEDNVPYTGLRGGKAVCWLPLLWRLTQPGQSFALPMHCAPTLSKSVTQAHKESANRFATKKDKDAGQVRVWRTR
jgi:hypothetical protein